MRRPGQLTIGSAPALPSTAPRRVRSTAVSTLDGAIEAQSRIQEEPADMLRGLLRRWARLGSNQRPWCYEHPALTAELRARINVETSAGAAGPELRQQVGRGPPQPVRPASATMSFFVVPTCFADALLVQMLVGHPRPPESAPADAKPARCEPIFMSRVL
jgi:hypothetical protein